MVQDPPKSGPLDPKSGLLEPHPLNPPTKSSFLVHNVPKRGPHGQARSQDRIWGGAEPPKVDLLDPKSGLSEPHPLNPPTKIPFLAHFLA